MKDWLWISAVVLLALFVLGLCWLFFSKYCPCRRTRSPEPVLPTHVEPQIPTVTQREWIRPTSPWAPLVTPKAHPPVPRRYPIPPSAPHYYALSPTNSPNLHLKFADLPINEVVKTDRGITTLDLHHMTVREAIQTTNAFLQQSFGIHEKVRIVTGRGLHSEGGTPRLKPAIELLLEKGDFEFREVNNGGCFEDATLLLINCKVNRGIGGKETFPNISFCPGIKPGTFRLDYHHCTFLEYSM